MATTNDPDPNGEMKLVDYFHESSSGHYDESRVVTLSSGTGSYVGMEIFTDSCNQFSGPRSESRQRWKIEREQLIDLIRKHGEPVR
ncbi:hypothetical protein bAD24_p00900 (plasmid) [Burkholderia sp. AD24]|nr:hypothetical protein bAD24_p00900 [Burkholderia sp. AD24]